MQTPTNAGIEMAETTASDTADAAIIGGSFAGLSAALYIARGRRKVVVIDDGQPRNRFASQSHSFFGQDGKSPAAVREAGLADVLRYPSARVINGRVLSARREGDGFHLIGPNIDVKARRIILAYGMRDVLPNMPGLHAAWGHTVFQCPYCHGYEAADRPTGLLMAGEGAMVQAMLLQEWAKDMVVFSHGGKLPDTRPLTQRGIRIETAPVRALHVEGADLRGVELADGRLVAREVLYLSPRAEPSCDLGAQLGVAMTAGPFGDYVTTDGARATTVPGVWAAGDLARPMSGAAFAVSDGAIAGMACHKSLALNHP